MNKYATPEEIKLDLLYIDEVVEQKQIESLKAVRARRDNDAVDKALATLEATARAGGNLMPPILEGVRAYASVGEIINRLRLVFGEYTDPGYF